MCFLRSQRRWQTPTELADFDVVLPYSAAPRQLDGSSCGVIAMIVLLHTSSSASQWWAQTTSCTSSATTRVGVAHLHVCFSSAELVELPNRKNRRFIRNPGVWIDLSQGHLLKEYDV